MLFCFPVCYVAYLGASLQVCCVVLGSAVLAFMLSSAGFVVSGKDAFRNYSGALGFALLVVTLKLICPRNSTIPRHALKQALAVMVGNVLVTNVIPEKTVRTRISLYSTLSALVVLASPAIITSVGSPASTSIPSYATSAALYAGQLLELTAATSGC